MLKVKATVGPLRWPVAALSAIVLGSAVVGVTPGHATAQPGATAETAEALYGSTAQLSTKRPGDVIEARSITAAIAASAPGIDG
ncbi:hypothetical protein [Nocardia neocaledoniensis]|uniref:hypothetical protein n=1 Tax=Nocardia neocaledoniensis TaxID=236511 RepID=UPI002454DD60|nr:hypothetical protein [Nocardia neocaledoniensis]